MKNIGIVGMSAKPFHRGHEDIILTASKECDHVYVAVSMSDRKRKNEHNISGMDMLWVWSNYIRRCLPENVEVIYIGVPPQISENNGNDKLKICQRIVDAVYENGGQGIVSPKTDAPVCWSWWLIDVLDHVYGMDTAYSLYVGPGDTNRFGQVTIQKYARNPSRVNVRVMCGAENERLHGLSGTLMRQWLSEGNGTEFMNNLPTFISDVNKLKYYTFLKSAEV